jgi:predicted DNA-binding transcriptional regulator AlpA
MKHKDNSRPLLTPDAAAAWLGIPLKTLAWWRYQQRGPTYIHMGKRVGYRPSDLETWVESQAISSNGG